MRVEVQQLTFDYGRGSGNVLNNLSFSIDAGEVAALLGPNGAGKTTLFRCMLGLRKPVSGGIWLDGVDLRGISPRTLSGKLAYIPQSSADAFHYTVLESVLMGVTGRLGVFAAPRQADVEDAMEALKRLGIGHLRDSLCTRISGGERQLALVARALVQRANLLLLDEPTANLDLGNSHNVMTRIAALSRQGYTVLFSTHQPEQAFRYASRALALCDGALVADGTPETVLTGELLSRLYRVPVAVTSAGTQRISVSIPTEDGQAE